MYTPKELTNMTHVNLVFKHKDGRTFSLSIDDNCGVYKTELRRNSILIWDAEGKDLLHEEWVSDERFLEILADFYGKKLVDKETADVS